MQQKNSLSYPLTLCLCPDARHLPSPCSPHWEQALHFYSSVKSTFWRTIGPESGQFYPFFLIFLLRPSFWAVLIWIGAAVREKCGILGRIWIDSFSWHSPLGLYTIFFDNSYTFLPHSRPYFIHPMTSPETYINLFGCLFIHLRNLEAESSPFLFFGPFPACFTTGPVRTCSCREAVLGFSPSGIAQCGEFPLGRSTALAC